MKLQKFVLTNIEVCIKKELCLIEIRLFLLIDVQKAFNHKSWGKRNNPMAEDNITALLTKFREKKFLVIHVQHTSKNSTSLFHLSQNVKFMDFAFPRDDEKVFQKEVNSAFIGTGLNEFLKLKKINSLVVVGFTSDHCVSTSVRMASNLGFWVFVVSDATATFNRIKNDINYEADIIHEINLVSLHKEFATILTTKDVIEQLEKI